jgi:hypothetical protein
LGTLSLFYLDLEKAKEAWKIKMKKKIIVGLILLAVSGCVQKIGGSFAGVYDACEGDKACMKEVREAMTCEENKSLWKISTWFEGCLE